MMAALSNLALTPPPSNDQIMMAKKIPVAIGCRVYIHLISGNFVLHRKYFIIIAGQEPFFQSDLVSGL
jgi:hypothetical protein